MSQCHDRYEWVEELAAEEDKPVTQCHDPYPEWADGESRRHRHPRARLAAHRHETDRAPTADHRI